MAAEIVAPEQLTGVVLPHQTAETDYINIDTGIDITSMPIPYTFEQILAKRTVMFRRHGDIPGASGLPPKEFWLLDITDPKNRVETPVDDRGLVIIDDLVRLVKSFIDPSYRWPKETSLDHLYFDEEIYRQLGPQAVKFRELPVHKVIVPRVFENVKHRIIDRPEPPEPEVMAARIESWSIASNLFNNMKNVELWRQRDRRRVHGVLSGESAAKPKSIEKELAGRAILREIMSHHFRGVEQNLELLGGVAPEDRFVEPDDPHDAMIDKLCRLVAAEALHLVGSIAA